jgi:TusA-related sulfurtransferase
MIAEALVIDVRDMVCAQALALIARRMPRVSAGGALTVLYNAEDVRRDVRAWAAERGHALREDGPGRLQLRAKAPA